MKTLLVCRAAPFPPTTGSPLRLWQQVNLLHSLGPVSVFSIGPALGEHSETPQIADWIHIDTDEHKTPTLPNALRFLKFFKPTQFPAVGDFADRDLNRRLKAFIDHVDPDLVVLSHWANAMPDALRGRKRLIVDSHNIESKLWSDMSTSGSLEKAFRYWRYSRRETSLSEAAAATWVTSELDKAFLTRMSRKPISVSVWPNAIDLLYYDPSVMARAGEDLGLGRCFPTLIFVGFMAYGPNHDAAVLLINEILPRIRLQYPRVRTFIVGKSPREELVSLAKTEANVFVTGTVSDVRPYLALSDLAVVPLAVGGGTRLKLLEAFASRVAVVSTTKGAEGIATLGSPEVAIADTTDDMVREILALLDDQGRRLEQVNRAYELVESNFSWQALIRRLPTELSTIMSQ
jgi:glycosyltransferase involved in cell wall biosynthesis